MMPALIFIAVIIALWVLIEAFKESFWTGLFLIFYCLAISCVVAGFLTGFGFLIFWPIAAIMFKIASDCSYKSGEQKTKLTPEQKRRKDLGYDGGTQVQPNTEKHKELNRYYQIMAVAATEERRQFAINKINELRKDLGYE